MEQPRLTGLEYFWFSRGQLAAARHPMRGTPGPEVAMAVLMEDIIKDARTFADGPRSLRHVADRFTLAADEVQSQGQSKAAHGTAGSTTADYYGVALRSLATSFMTAAAELEEWKRRWPEPVSSAANPETSDGALA